ncbi:MAG: glycoside hydrolase family 5 protein [Candidatus Fimivivens sp.]
MKTVGTVLATLLFLLALIGCQSQLSEESTTIGLLASNLEESSIQAAHESAPETNMLSLEPVIPTDTCSSKPSSKQTESAEPLPEKTQPIGYSPIAPYDYQALLGKGMDVDWCKTAQGRAFYNETAVADFQKAGVQHVRIRIKDNADEALLLKLDEQIADCLAHGIIPIIAYQANEFKNEPNQENIDKVVVWWTKVAERYQDQSHLLAFDLLIEATDALNKQPEKLNEIYEQLVTAIRKTNPTRIIMMSPRLRSDAAYLSELTLPTDHNEYMMAEWHFYASGPSKTNERKLWTTGTDAEKQLILEKINLALKWQKDTGIPTWVGAWMPSNYNDGNDYTINEQIKFASFMTQSLADAQIPFAVNSDTKFYDRARNLWVSNMTPVLNAIYR